MLMRALLAVLLSLASAANAYDVYQGFAGSKELITPTTVLVDQAGSAVSAINPLPAITEYGSIISNTDHYGTQQYNAPNGETVTVPLYKLIGDIFTGAALDPNFWTINVGTGGAIAISGGQLTISTGTTANNVVEITTTRTARFSGIAPNKFRSVVQLPDAGVVNNVRHWGLWTATSGATFEMSGTTFQITTRKAGVDTVVADGSVGKPFNGQYGPTAFVPGLTSHVYEIIWQPRQVTWLVDQKVLHTLNANAAPWTDDLHLPIHFGSVNSGGLATNVSFSARLAVVARFGIPQMQPKSAFVQGLTAGVNLKNTPGNLHGIILSGITNNSVLTVYDNTTAAGTVIWASGPLVSNGLPFYLDMKGIPFSVGLSVSVTGAALNALMLYE